MPDRINNQNSTAEIDFSALEEWVENYIRNLVPEMTKALEDARDELYEDIQDHWPVKTGASKAGFKKYLTIKEVNGDYYLSAGIKNTVPYVYYIKVGKKSAWNEYVKKPSQKLTQSITKSVYDHLSKVNNGK